MLFRPGFAVGAFVFANYDNGNIGFSRSVGGGADAGGLRGRIRDINFIFVPRRPALLAGSDLAALGEDNFHARLNPFADSVENADLVPWAGVTAVAADVNVGGVRTDDGDRLQFRRIERKKIAVVLQQDDGFLRDFQRQLLMLGTVRSALRVIGINVRILEEP